MLGSGKEYCQGIENKAEIQYKFLKKIFCLPYIFLASFCNIQKKIKNKNGIVTTKI